MIVTHRTVFPAYGATQGRPVFGTAGFGAGPLRHREIQTRSHGLCVNCRTEDDLFNGWCSFCRWMKNDTEAGDGR